MRRALVILTLLLGFAVAWWLYYQPEPSTIARTTTPLPTIVPPPPTVVPPAKPVIEHPVAQAPEELEAATPVLDHQQPLEELLDQAIEIEPNLSGVLVVAEESGYSQENVLQTLETKMPESKDVLARAAMDADYDHTIINRVLNGDSVTPGKTPSASAPAGQTAASSTTINIGRGGGATVSPSEL